MMRLRQWDSPAFSRWNAFNHLAVIVDMIRYTTDDDSIVVIAIPSSLVGGRGYGVYTIEKVS